jgi:MOSC domain-containing protein
VPVSGLAVSTIAVSPVRCFGLSHPEEVEVTEAGVVENRRFLLVDAAGERLRSSVTYWPIVLSGRYDAAREILTVQLPDGTELEGSALALGERVHPKVDDRTVPSRVVEGPWTEPLSRLAGRPVWIARPDRPGMAQPEPLTVVSEGSVARLGREAGKSVDGRRFRMLFTVRGCRAHEEDEWEGRLVRFGEAVIRVGGPVPRCALTTRSPDTGERDLDTLNLIKAYRGVRDGDAIDFGVYARVEEPGRVRVGDLVELL